LATRTPPVEFVFRSQLAAPSADKELSRKPTSAARHPAHTIAHRYDNRVLCAVRGAFALPVERESAGRGGYKEARDWSFRLEYATVSHEPACADSPI